MEFKDRLRQLRKETGETQTEVASVLGYGYTAVANYEAGRNEPNINDLKTLARHFKVTVDYLIGNV